MDKLNFMNSVPVPKVKKSVFDLTHDVKMSCNMGWLIPAMVFDAVPGESFKISHEALVRFAPMVAPVMHRMHVTFHTWFVPYRILWDNWEDYITETKTAGVLPAFPTWKVKTDGTGWSQLLDYLGIPQPWVGAEVDETISAMRMAAYQCVYNEFYRDQNMVAEVDYKLVDGDNSANADLLQLRKRAWTHDYFTSNLPFAQKGDAVKMPIQLEDAPVMRGADPALFVPPSAESVWPTPGMVAPAPSGGDVRVTNQLSGDAIIDAGQQLYANMDGISGQTTINEFRLALALQRYLERAARAGTRLVEWIKGMFNETLPDYTAQRPQYVGGTKSPVQISEVLNTTGETGGLPQGNMAGRGISVAEGKGSSFRTREHGVFITMMSIMPETAYQQGIEREWKKYVDPKDFLNPLFAHLGEQETLISELQAYKNGNVGTFGYLPRFAEYRTIPNRVAGTFRTTENYWTMSRIFSNASLVALNDQFIESDPTHRIFADTDPDNAKLYVHVLNRVRAVRPLPKYGTPGI